MGANVERFRSEMETGGFQFSPHVCEGVIAEYDLLVEIIENETDVTVEELEEEYLAKREAAAEKAAEKELKETRAAVQIPGPAEIPGTTVPTAEPAQELDLDNLPAGDHAWNKTVEELEERVANARQSTVERFLDEEKKTENRSTAVEMLERRLAEFDLASV